MFKYLTRSILAITLILPQQVQAQCWSIPVSLEARVQASETIVMGSLLGQKAYWDATHSNIYTLNFIKVDAYLKGSGPAEIAVATMGGVVGYDAQVTTPSLSLRYENEYVLFLEHANEDVQSLNLKTRRPDIPQFVPFAATQGALTKQFDQFFDVLSEAPQTESELFGRIYQQTQQAALAPGGSSFEPRSGVTKSIWDWEQNLRGGSITNITPNPSHAGTVDTDDFVTITGSGFGAESNVFYANANDGGATLIASGVASDVVSWSDTEIVSKPAGDAGTGTVQVNGLTSNLTIDWAHIEINNQGAGFPEVTRQGYRLVDLNSEGGLTFIYNTSFAANTDASDSFERALETWRCTTFVNYDRTTASTSAIGAAADDGVNIVTFNGSLPDGVLGRATSYFSGSATAGCQLEDTFWWLKELDVQFAPDPPVDGFTWNYGPGNPTGSQPYTSG